MNILSTSYFPDLSYCSHLEQKQDVTIDLGEHFIKQTIRNRCEILGANGILKLVVPLTKWRNRTPVRDIKISYDNQWQKLHWKSIESAYRSSPYFEYYEDRLKNLILSPKHLYLYDLNEAILNFVLQSLDIDTSVSYVKDYIEKSSSDSDYRIQARKTKNSTIEKPYIQVFSDRHDFAPNLSILDLMCNEGPNSILFLIKE